MFVCFAEISGYSFMTSEYIPTGRLTFRPRLVGSEVARRSLSLPEWTEYFVL